MSQSVSTLALLSLRSKYQKVNCAHVLSKKYKRRKKPRGTFFQNRERARASRERKQRGSSVSLVQRRLGLFDSLEHVLLVGGHPEHDAQHDDERHVDAEEHPQRRRRVVGLDHSVDTKREEDAREDVDANEAQWDQEQVERRVAAAKHFVIGRALLLRLLVRLDSDDVHVVWRDAFLRFGRHGSAEWGA